MRAVVGGLVTSVEPWSYADKSTGATVLMQSVFVLGGKTVDKIAVPVDVAQVEPGAEYFFVADVSISRRKGNQGGEFVDLSIWARHAFAYDCDPYAKTGADTGIHAVS